MVCVCLWLKNDVSLDVRRYFKWTKNGKCSEISMVAVTFYDDDELRCDANFLCKLIEDSCEKGDWYWTFNWEGVTDLNWWKGKRLEKNFRRLLKNNHKAIYFSKAFHLFPLNVTSSQQRPTFHLDIPWFNGKNKTKALKSCHGNDKID